MKTVTILSVILSISLIASLLSSCKVVKTGAGSDDYEVCSVIEIIEDDNESDTSVDNSTAKKKGSKTVTKKTGTSSTSTSKKTSSSNSSDEENEEYLYDYLAIDQKMMDKSVLVKGNSARIAAALKKAKSGQKLNVVFFGGSITQGVGASNSKNCYAALTANWFENKFGPNSINYINAGIGGTGSFIGTHRADTDVISKKPDIIFVDFSVNDDPVERDEKSYDGLMQKLYNSPTSPAIIAVAMTTDEAANCQKYEQQVCKAYGIPMLSYKDALFDAMGRGLFTWNQVGADYIHPNNTGHLIISELIISYLEGITSNLSKIDTSITKNISTVYRDSRYATAKRLSPSEITPTAVSGFSSSNGKFCQLAGYWEAQTIGSEMTFTVNTKTVSVIFGRNKNNAGAFDVYVDGVKIKSINTKWPYEEQLSSECIKEFDTVGTHTVKIVTIKPTDSNNSRVVITGIGITN